LPLFYATAFAATAIGPDEVLLLIGQAVAPVFPGTVAQQQAAMAKLKTLSVSPLGRVILSARHLDEIINALQQVKVSQAALAANPPALGHAEPS
jgi:hypothetical protein